MPHADQRLIQALLDNNRQGIEEIYSRFAPRISRFVLSNSGSDDDAHDVFQESLLAIARQARGGKFELTCPFEAFLYLVARGKWLNELRRRKRETVTIRQAGLFEENHDASLLADALQQDESRSRLFHDAFESLSAGCRQLLQLSWAGNPMEKVAEMLGYTYGYARKKKSECVEKLTGLVRQSPDYQQLAAS